MISLKSDLDNELRIREETVSFGNGRFLVTGEGDRISMPVKEIKEALVEEGVGIGKLVLRLNNGKELEAVYFTKPKVKSYRKFADALNYYIRTGKEPNVKFEENKKAIGGIHTLRWLYGFSSKHRNIVILGIILSLVMVGLNLVPPYLLKVLIDNVILSQGHSIALFEELTIVLIVSYALSTVVSSLQSYVLNVSGNRIVRELKGRLFGHAVRLHAKEIDNITASRIQSRLISDTDRTQWLMTYGISTLITNALTILGIGAILFLLFPSLAVYVLLPIPLIIAIIAVYNKRSDKAYHQQWRRFSDLITKIDDVIPNYAVVKSSAKEDYEENRFRKGLDDFYVSQVGVNSMELKYWQPVAFLVSLVTVAIWWIGGNLVIVGTIQLGVVTAFLAYLGMFYSPIQQLSSIMPYIQSALTSGERLREVFDSDVALDNKRGKAADLSKSITFENVWFGYDPLFPVVKGINVEFRQGKITAVVGKSGAGKSTIVRLLLGLYMPDSGSVRFGGVDISRIDIRYLRSRIAYVPQESTFFDNTISYNMSYSAENADRVHIIAAAKAVEMHEEIMKLPLSYDNRIRGRGLSLSGGQRQRLAIARAMLSRADIVVLDEITSSLDVINSRKVNRAVLKLQKEKTIISITHDVNEITNSDYSVVLKDGVVVEQGRTASLIRKGGELKKMFKYKLEERVKKQRETGIELLDYLGGIMASEDNVTISEGRRKSFVNISANGRTYRDAVPKRPFPVSDPRIVLFYNGKEEPKEVLALRDYTRLDGESMKALDNALEISNYNPKVVQIKSIRVTGDGLDWKLVSDKGEMNVLTKNRNDVLDRGAHVILIDEYNTPLKISLAYLDKDSIKRLKETI